ncbi:MAG: hypothetical protein A2038_12270 [Deltaproteobacteria bacterium GWA2_57_13]|nr:MAG: hypothetical protein A2038_12270 [Deltaproteobacteria bacterium GWA2_57_13]OGQ85119.1 MAG: hypothetical protein A3G40_16145 [Deltaproteobacteria bacterium RIFCSPLOWO2_12_FULL_57_22]
MQAVAVKQGGKESFSWVAHAVESFLGSEGAAILCDKPSGDKGREETGQEETVREVYRRRLATVDAEVADHKARGESLLGREKDFTIRCN